VIHKLNDLVGAACGYAQTWVVEARRHTSIIKRHTKDGVIEPELEAELQAIRERPSGAKALSKFLKQFRSHHTAIRPTRGLHLESPVNPP
jgi:hypothetical protein